MHTVDRATDRPALAVATIVLVLVTGVMTGAQLAKLAPLIPWYAGEDGLSLVGAGWLTAMLGIFIALGALPAGWAIDRAGLLRSIMAGAAALVVGGALLALAREPALVFAARLVEAIGYLVLCIALPAVLNAIAAPQWKGPVLAIWSGFVPLGFATSDFVAGAMLPSFAPSAFLGLMVALFAVPALLAAAALRRVRIDEVPVAEEGRLRATLVAPVVLLAASFGAFVVVSLSMFTFLPTYVAGEGSHYLVSAGVIALSVPLGNLAAGALVRGRGARFMAGLGVMGFAVSALAAVPAFTLQSPGAATAAAFALAISGALVASAQFAAIPFVTPARGSVSVAIGLVCQAGGIGTVLGPPIAAAVIERSGWTGLGWFIAAVSLAGLACVLPLALGRRAVSVAAEPPVP